MNHGSYTIFIANAAFVNPPNTASEPEKMIVFARDNLNMPPGRLWKTAGLAGSAAAAAAVGSFRGVKHSRGRTKESKAGGIILVNTVKDIRNLLFI